MARVSGSWRGGLPARCKMDRVDHDAQQWWRTGVVYQIYPRSFMDSDGDGIGDLRGIRSRLGAVAELGVEAIWLSPFYPSPQVDGGYDVSDHRDVDPLFGTLDEFDLLVRDAHDLGLRVVIDVVPNHTSDQHRWFRDALSSGQNSRARARYVFRDGRSGGDAAPNDWRSVFGGSAWTRVTEPDGRPGQWYLHLFATEQPDLDWTNDDVLDEFDAILEFWLDRGVDGFRIDVAHGLRKHPAMADLDGQFETSGLAAPGHPHWDRDEVHEIYRRWRRIADRYDGERAFVAEAYLQSPERLARYVRQDELHTAFNFRFLLAPWDGPVLRSVIDETVRTHADVGAPPTWVLSNHDVVRTVSRYGGGMVGSDRARAAALLMFALPGVAYVYQGEELGLPEVEDLPDELRQDPTFRRTGGAEPGRDGCRVPLPWSDTTAPFGFSPTVDAWLPQPADWSALTRAAQHDDAGSMLNLYRDAIVERSARWCGAGALEWIDGAASTLAFRRGSELVCVTNLSADPIPSPVTGTARVLLSSRPLLRPDEHTADGHTTDEIAPAEIPSDTTVWYLVTPETDAG